MPSYQSIERRDLKRLARLAREERDELFERHVQWGQRYRSALLFTILGGQAANHYASGMSGFTTFDVITFYAERDGRAFPKVPTALRDFGPSRHGRHTDAAITFIGRQVVLSHRPMTPSPGLHPLEQLQHYLHAGRAPTARRLRSGSVVFIEPLPLLGLMAWPALAVTPPPPKRASGLRSPTGSSTLA